MPYTQAQLADKPRNELRDIARGLGVKSSLAHKPAEIVRSILTAQKPGGFDARINPKAAKAAKDAKAVKDAKPAAPREPAKPAADVAPVVPTESEPTKASAPVKGKGNVADAKPAVKATLRAAPANPAMATLEDRVANVESLLATAGLFQPPVTVDSFFDAEGNLAVNPADLARASIDTLFKINQELKQAGLETAKLGDELAMRQRPDVARTEIARVLLKQGIVTRDAEAAAKEVDKSTKKIAKQDAEAYVWPPEHRGQELEVATFRDDKAEVMEWFPATFIKSGEETSEDGDKFIAWGCRATIEGEVVDLGVEEGDIRAIPRYKHLTPNQYDPKYLEEA